MVFASCRDYFESAQMPSLYADAASAIERPPLNADVFAAADADAAARLLALMLTPPRLPPFSAMPPF